MRIAAKHHAMDPKADPTVPRLRLRSLKVEDMDPKLLMLEVATDLKMEELDLQIRMLRVPSKAIDRMSHRILTHRALRTT